MGSAASVMHSDGFKVVVPVLHWFLLFGDDANEEFRGTSLPKERTAARVEIIT